MIDEVYEKIINYGIATEQELNLITNINGWNIETLNDVIYVRTGYRSIDQYEDYEGGVE